MNWEIKGDGYTPLEYLPPDWPATRDGRWDANGNCLHLDTVPVYVSGEQPFLTCKVCHTNLPMPHAVGVRRPDESLMTPPPTVGDVDVVASPTEASICVFGFDERWHPLGGGKDHPGYAHGDEVTVKGWGGQELTLTVMGVEPGEGEHDVRMVLDSGHHRARCPACNPRGNPPPSRHGRAYRRRQTARRRRR